MIRCANCGTLNRKGSNYCSNCGQRLEALSDISCPSCARLNTPDSTNCKFCGALLIASVPAAEGTNITSQQSLPEGEAMPAEVENAKAVQPRPELPSWLYEPSSPAERDAGRERPTPPSPTALTSPVLPEPSLTEQSENKYLKDIRGVLPSADAWLKLPAKPESEK